MKRLIFLLMFIALMVAGCGGGGSGGGDIDRTAFAVTSTSWDDGGPIDIKYTSIGGAKPVAPQIYFDNVPADAEYLSLFMTTDDEICKTETAGCTYWYIINLPKTRFRLAEDENLLGSVLPVGCVLCFNPPIFNADQIYKYVIAGPSTEPLLASFWWDDVKTGNGYAGPSQNLKRVYKLVAHSHKNIANYDYDNVPTQVDFATQQFENIIESAVWSGTYLP